MVIVGYRRMNVAMHVSFGPLITVAEYTYYLIQYIYSSILVKPLLRSLHVCHTSLWFIILTTYVMNSCVVSVTFQRTRIYCPPPYFPTTFYTMNASQECVIKITCQKHDSRYMCQLQSGKFLKKLNLRQYLLTFDSL